MIPLLDCLPPVARNHKLNLQGETLGRRIRRLAPCPNTSHHTHTHTLLNTQNEYTKLIQTATGSRPRCPRTQLHEQRLNKNGIKGIEAKVEKHGKTLRPPRVYHAATMLPPCCHHAATLVYHGESMVIHGGTWGSDNGNGIDRIGTVAYQGNPRSSDSSNCSQVQLDDGTGRPSLDSANLCCPKIAESHTAGLGVKSSLWFHRT